MLDGVSGSDRTAIGCGLSCLNRLNEVNPSCRPVSYHLVHAYDYMNETWTWIFRCKPTFACSSRSIIFYVWLINRDVGCMSAIDETNAAEDHVLIGVIIDGYGCARLTHGQAGELYAFASAPLSLPHLWYRPVSRVMILLCQKSTFIRIKSLDYSGILIFLWATTMFDLTWDPWHMCHTISNKYILYVYMVMAIELGQNGQDWVAKLEGQIHVQPSLTTGQVQPEPALIVSQPYSTALPELNVGQPI